MKPAILFLALLAWLPAGIAQASSGADSAGREYRPHSLPRFAGMRDQLPAPIYDENPEWIAMYWKAWELAFSHFYEPAPGSHFVSQFIDAAFNRNIFLWDTCFMSMFCNVAHPLVPGIGSLDNFYAKQHEDGEICREISRSTGLDYGLWVDREGLPLFSRDPQFSREGWLPEQPDAPVVYRGRAIPQPPPLLTLDALNDPVAAWAELESLRFTGDRARIATVLPPLQRYYRALQKYLRQGNGLYVTDWAGMDNSTRNRFIANGGMGVDISCQMVLFARNLATMSDLMGNAPESRAFAAEADGLSRTINQLMWDPRRRFYFDLAQDDRRAPVKTVAAFWSLVAGVASPGQAVDLVAELRNPNTFGRPNRVPSLAANEPDYNPAGGYWRGSVWAPMTMMVMRGLESYGYREEARRLAIDNLELMGGVYRRTGTIWENYSPETASPGRPAKPDFVGWGGLGPIEWLLEFAIGLKPDAPGNELGWELRSPDRQGCERYRFNGHVVSLVAQPTPDGSGGFTITVKSDGAFTLRLTKGAIHRTVDLKPGEQTVSL